MPISRRVLISAGAGAALIVAIDRWGFSMRASRSAAPRYANWLAISGDDSVRVFCYKAELGQGIRTAVATLVAEELDVHPDRIVVEQAPVDPDRYDHLTVGSASVHDCWKVFRTAAATARALLIRAAASRWSVKTSVCRTAQGSVYGPSGKSIPYGALAQEAAQLSLSDGNTLQTSLKSRERWTAIGTDRPDGDIAEITSGAVRFGIDTRIPGMVFAVVHRNPSFIRRITSARYEAARKVPGVIRVFPVPPVGSDAFTPGGIAVVATDTWAAIAGRKALSIVVSPPPPGAASSSKIALQLRSIATERARVLRNEGEAPVPPGGDGESISASYELPFAPHMTMEPMNATVSIDGDTVSAWLPTQNAADARKAIARILKRPERDVRIHMTRVGGGFGRRDATDFAVEAAQVADVVRRPVQLIWTREDDCQHDRARPAAVHILSARVSGGAILAWSDQMASTSIEAFLAGGHTRTPERTEIGGAIDLPYAIPRVHFSYGSVDAPIPVGWWRGVENSINAFSTEGFLNELASRAGEDPLTLRLRHLPPGSISVDHDGRKLSADRLRAVLERVARASRWDSAPAESRALGIACHFCRGSYIAVVAECSVGRNQLEVHNVWAAVDCGQPVNRLGVVRQIEGGIVWGLSAALHQEITVSDGVVVQSNFHDAPVLRMNECPAIRVEVLESHDVPTGVGEIGCTAVPPAVAGAMLRLTGVPVRSLPIRLRCVERV